MIAPEKQAPTWALVPLKSRERAKSRLATVLTPEQRARLFFGLAERVIRALHATRGIDSVAVVTASAEIAAFARSLGAVPVVQSDDFGMSAAFDLALDELHHTKPRRVLMLPGDLPLISSDALEAVLHVAGAEPGIVVVPDRHRVGTNALLCTPPRALAPCFGGHSFERHLAAAKAAGVTAQVLESDALALDLDHPEDLDCLRHRDGALAAQLLGTLTGVNAVDSTSVADRCAALAVNRR
jgi:2-phospho-L-lactate/phosphoenolpyruvate guanylyltransferase